MKPGLLRPSLVEPLSRQAWERVETRLFERLGRGEHLPAQNISVRGPAPVRVWLGAAALVLTGTVLLWLVLDTLHHGAAPISSAQLAHAPLMPPAVVARQLEPHATTAPARSSAAPASKTVNESTRIVTTTAPTRTLLGEAALTLAANSDVRVRGNDEHGWLVELESGEVDCEVGPRRGRPPFVVQAGQTRVSVIGTRFSVTRDGSSAHVSVLEGHVQVESGKSVAHLGPGDRWPADAAADKQLGARTKARAARSPEPARARFERAARLEASDPSAALEIYANLAKSRGPWAANALYAQARLESERGHGERANQLFERYLELYPRGVNAPDVRALQSRH